MRWWVDDPATGLAQFMTVLARVQYEHRGVAEFLGAGALGRHSEAFIEHAEYVRAAAQQLVARAHRVAAVHSDLTWRDVVMLCQAIGASRSCLGIRTGEHQWQRALAVVLAGLNPGTGDLAPRAGTAHA